MLYPAPTTLDYALVHCIEYILFLSDGIVENPCTFRLRFWKTCIIHFTVQKRNYFLDFHFYLSFLRIIIFFRLLCIYICDYNRGPPLHTVIQPI